MRRILFSVPALALACATSSGDQQSGTRRAQDAAQEQYQNAATAQKRANEEQQKAEQADRDVAKAQKALADAQLRREGQHGKAAQAQQDAARTARDAQERGAEMQAQATQMQAAEGRQGQRVARAQTETVRGAVAAVSPDFMTVRSDDEGELRLQVTDATIVNLDGQKVAISAIQAGSDVSASYGVRDGRMMALRLEVTSSHAGSMPRTLEPSSSEGK